MRLLRHHELSFSTDRRNGRKKRGAFLLRRWSPTHSRHESAPRAWPPKVRCPCRARGWSSPRSGNSGRRCARGRPSGITGPKLCTEKIASAPATKHADGDRACRRSSICTRCQCTGSAASPSTAGRSSAPGLRLRSLTATFMLASRSFRLATTSSIKRLHAHLLDVNGNLAGVEPRRGQQARGQLAQQARSARRSAPPAPPAPAKDGPSRPGRWRPRESP